MPTAEVKQETAISQDVNDPFIKAVAYLKYKLKNLDQRKKNLELLKEKVDAGQEKDMELGQVQAITKLPEVSNIHGHLEQVLVRLMKHHDELVRHEKTRKQQLKQERQNNDLQRVHRVLLVQDVLNSIDDRVRDDLLNGRRGAPKLTDEKLNQLDEMFKMVTPTRDNADLTLKDQMLSSAEHLLKLADYSQKKVLDTTYEAIARLLDQVSQSGVLEELVEDAAGEPQEEEAMEDADVTEECCEEVQQDGDVGDEVVDGGEPTAVVEQVVENGHEGELVNHAPHPQPPAAAVAETVAAETFSPPTVNATSVAAPPPTQQHHQQPAIQFLQDSELAPRSDPSLLADPAVVGYSTSSPPAATSDPTIAGVSAEYHAPQPQRPPQQVAAIPTQTFTNSNYAAAGETAAGDSAPNPPPPIPMPRRAVEESTCWADEPEDPPVQSQRQPTVGGEQWVETDDGSTAAAGDDAWKQPQQDDWATAGAGSEWINSSSSRQYDEGRRGGYRGGRGGQNGYYGGGGGRGPRPYRGGGGGGGGGGYRGGRGGYGGGGGGDRRGGRRGGGGGGDRPYRGGRGGPRQ